ncbi:hypothetical protein Glove_469g19 [Diversispora epigaea]|uniref:Protein kinase domain-containing protein n=1 Tax=Diversispora epigaea TaxID=1348612 RepID=A0A397GLA7_9GLOM|nr:hypothetical protein Glove_469g19 [Diversispora epigaea]
MEKVQYAEIQNHEEKAFQSYLKSAEGGNSYGQSNLGCCYENGIGTTKYEEKAFHWYLKSAEGGNITGQYNLGHCYQHGIGTTKDEKKAFQWYLKSTERGNIDGQNNLGDCYRNGIGTTKDEEKAFQWYLKSAEGGNSYGQFNLGRCYENGIGTTKDEEKAFQWYLKSAEGGNVVGQSNLGCCYENGIGTTKDEEKAFQWYLKSAEGRDSNGQHNLGYCYHNGIGTTKDEEKAFQWYLKSAEGGNVVGQSNLGFCYKNGIGTTKDEEKAFQWYLKSAEGGNIICQYNLGHFYQHGIGTTKDEEKAFQWYLKSAEGGNSYGQSNLGYCYENGIGTTKDEEKAFQWYLKSAEGGYSYGQYNLGNCYENGIGTTKDEEKAFQWYSKSAEGGNIVGQSNLGCCYENGIGTIKDEEKAFQWYLKSAEGGNSYGQYNLGYCYENGIGTTKDEEKAFQWYLKSAEGGNSYGQYTIGHCYENGIGTTKDEEKAFQWYSKSAERENRYGQNAVEYLYRNERGITKIKRNIDNLMQDTKNDDIKDHSFCCICWKENGCSKICINYYQNFGLCHDCGNLNINKNICINCKLIEISYLSKWTSGDYEIDKIIRMSQLDENAKEWEIWRWIDYSEFKNIEYLAEGGFAHIWKAEWIDIPEELFGFYNSNQVALKKLKNSQQTSFEFLKELLVNFYCRDKYILPILGITQDLKTKEYAIVLRYMKNGNLINFLQQNKTLPWKERIWLLNSFIRGLSLIHSKGFIHRDLHPGNLMITEAHNNSKFIRLGDLGLCKPVNEILSSGTYGVLPYIAPEVMNKNKYTKASDIYSVGIIMWVISTGKIPFEGESYDPGLAISIFNGYRPKIHKGTPKCYVDLMEKCWDNNPTERPSAEMIFNTLEVWIRDLSYFEKSENALIFLNADQNMQNIDSELLYNGTTMFKTHLISQPLMQHSLAIHESFSKLDINNYVDKINLDDHPNCMIFEKLKFSN